MHVSDEEFYASLSPAGRELERALREARRPTVRLPPAPDGAADFISVEEAKAIFRRQIAEIKAAFARMVEQLRIKVPRLTDGDIAVIQGLIAEALAGLDPDAIDRLAARPQPRTRGRS